MFITESKLKSVRSRDWWKQHLRRRKRNTTSYYSSLQCAKKLKYKSLPKTPKEKFVNNFSDTHCSTNFVFFPGCEQHPIIKDVACFIWHELPFNKQRICDVAVTMKDSWNPTFLDLCSLCPNPPRKTYTSLNANVHKRSTIGWLIANVVDCYVAWTTELCNSFHQFWVHRILHCGADAVRKKYKNVDKALSWALTTQTKTMRDNVFMPVEISFSCDVVWETDQSIDHTQFCERFRPRSAFCCSEKISKTFVDILHVRAFG